MYPDIYLTKERRLILSKRFGLHEKFIQKLKNDYKTHKGRAKRANIKWLFSFETWMQKWIDSGNIRKRGCSKGKYVMARFGDKGPYSPKNTKIVLHSENISQAHFKKFVSEATKEKIRAARKLQAPTMLGRHHSQKTKDQISRNKTNPLAATRKRISDAKKEWWERCRQQSCLEFLGLL